MVCKKCGNIVDKEDVVCNFCGTKLNEENKIYTKSVKEEDKNLKNVFRQLVQNKLFLIVSIFFSLFIFCLFITFLGGGLFGIGAVVLPMICGGITLIGLWSSYNHKKEKKHNLGLIIGIDIYNILIIAISTIITVLAMLQIDQAFAGIGSMGIIILVIIVGIIVGGIYIGSCVIKRIKYFNNLNKIENQGIYSSKLSASTQSYVVGTFFLFTGFMSLLELKTTQELVLIIIERSNLYTITAYKEIMLTIIMLGISNLLLGVYNILSGLWIEKTHASIKNYNNPPSEEVLEKLNAKTNFPKTIIVEETNKLFFPIGLTCFTLYIVLTLAIAILGGSSGVLLAAPTLIVSMIAFIGMWLLILSKNKELISSRIKKVAVYEAYNRVICTIMCIIIGVVGIDSLFKGWPADNSKIFLYVVIVIIIIVIMEAITILIRRVFKRRNDYLKQLSELTERGLFSNKKLPVVSSWIISVACIIIGIVIIVDSPAIKPLMEKLAYELELGSDLISLSSYVLIGYLMMAANAILMGLYTMMTTLWLQGIDKRLTNKREID